MAFDPSKTYRSSTTASIYDGSGNFQGFMKSGVSVKFVEGSDTTFFGNRSAARIAASPAAYFTRNGSSSASTNAAGYYAMMYQFAEVGNNGTVNTTSTTVSGSRSYISGIQASSNPTTYKVKTNYQVQTFTGPSSTEYTTGPVYTSGESIAIYATVKDDNGNTWGATNYSLTNWCLYKDSNGNLSTCLTTDDASSNQKAESTSTASQTQTTAKVNASGTVTDSSDATYNNMQDVVDSINEAASNMSYDDSESWEGLHNMQYVIGIPPKITPTADPRYMMNRSPSNNFGRAYTEMFMMGNTVFSIQPCKVKYLPGFNDEEKNTFFNMVASSVANLGDDASLVGADGVNLSGQLFEGQPDYNEYINTVNILARVISILLGIGEKEYMNTGKKYKNMDYSFYKIQDNSYRYESDGSLFGTVSSAVRWVGDKLVTSAINDDTYIHFYMTADGTSVNESMSVSTKSSGLESIFNNSLSELAQEIQFLSGGSTGAAVDEAINDAVGAVSGFVEGVGGVASATLGTTIGNLVKSGAGYLKGGRMVFPQMLDDCSYDRSYSGSCRFISSSGDPESIFLNCYLPLCYLWPYVLPQMLSDNMYRYPFLARCNAKGLFHCDLAAVTNMSIQRGGADGTCWTADGLPFEIDVSFNITPLYSKLMVTSARHPLLYLSNSALQEYLGALCGISFTGDQIKLKLGILRTLIGNEITDTIPSMLRGYYSSGVANFLRQLFNY